MKARKGPPKDYQEIRAKVEQASKLMAGGLSESRAAKTVGLPRSSLQHYLKHGIPKPALPKPEACQDDPAGQKQDASRPPAESFLPTQRDEHGRFLAGNTAGSLIDKPTRQARIKFEEATPKVAEKLIAIFEALPDDEPELVLAFAREILDRGLGRPKQVVDVKESREYIEYRYIQELILADPEAVRLAASLAERLEGHAGDLCGEALRPEMEALPPSA
ncbi:MAG: hypothetical protein BWY13_00063 [Euryarchaeota archaeon ADurb.Bin190]|nr:MAG: hypothetical protein BWY13_00063 [Euryarchaeota archaeon ADurb.Bin190]